MEPTCNKCKGKCQDAEHCEFDVGTLLARKKEAEDQEPASFDFLEAWEGKEDPWLDSKYE